MSPELKKQILLDYIKYKLDEGDYHAVSDACMDLRELEVQIKANDEISKVEDMVEAYIKPRKK